MFGVNAGFLGTAPLDDLQQPQFTRPERADLRGEICAAFMAAAHIGENQLHYVFTVLAAADDANWRNSHAFAIDVRGQPHRTRGSPANIRVMGAIGDVTKRPSSVVSCPLFLFRN